MIEKRMHIDRGRFSIVHFIGVVGFILQLVACGGGTSVSGAPAGGTPVTGAGGGLLPSVTITAPTSATNFSTNNASITLGGNASDSSAVTRVSWSNNLGGSGSQNFNAASVNWSFSNVALQSGANVLIVTATNAAGNTRTDQLTVTRASNVATLTWDDNPEPDFIGYRVYFGTSAGSYQQVRGAGIEVTDSSYTVTGLTSGVRYFFAVTAFDGSGNESVFSREVFKDIP